MIIKNTEKSKAAVELILGLSTLIWLADADKSCDIRHKFVPEKGNLIQIFYQAALFQCNRNKIQGNKHLGIKAHLLLCRV